VHNLLFHYIAYLSVLISLYFSILQLEESKVPEALVEQEEEKPTATPVTAEPAEPAEPATETGTSGRAIYSRAFLLSFQSTCTHLPPGVEPATFVEIARGEDDRTGKRINMIAKIHISVESFIVCSG
jgi:hypothetical protein